MSEPTPLFTLLGIPCYPYGAALALGLLLAALMALCLVLSLSACAVAEDAVRVYALMGPTGIGMVQMMDQNDGTYAFTLSGAPDEVVAAVANGLCEKGKDVTVRVKGGDLVVNYTDEKITLTGDAKLVYTGEAVY